MINVSVPLIHKFGLEQQINIKINKRGFRPDAGGEIYV